VAAKVAACGVEARTRGIDLEFCILGAVFCRAFSGYAGAECARHRTEDDLNEPLLLVSQAREERVGVHGRHRASILTPQWARPYL
jgi:hypothetical protein